MFSKKAMIVKESFRFPNKPNGKGGITVARETEHRANQFWSLSVRRVLRTLSLVGLWLGLGAGMAANAALSPAEALVKAADEIRNPGDSFEMNIKVEDSEGNDSVFSVFLKGKDKTMIVTKAPSRDRGRNMLMLDRDFNVYVPNLKRSMRLSLAQKLSGQVSNGDIARTRWFGDYDVKVEAIEGAEVRLFLKARRENLTYSALRLWVDKKTKRPLRAEYLGSNGSTVLKKAYFESYKNLEGALRPSVIRIQDPAGKTSRILINEMKKASLEDSFFTVRNAETLR